MRFGPIPAATIAAVRLSGASRPGSDAAPYIHRLERVLHLGHHQPPVRRSPLTDRSAPNEDGHPHDTLISAASNYASETCRQDGQVATYALAGPSSAREAGKPLDGSCVSGCGAAASPQRCGVRVPAHQRGQRRLFRHPWRGEARHEGSGTSWLCAARARGRASCSTPTTAYRAGSEAVRRWWRRIADHAAGLAQSRRRRDRGREERGYLDAILELSISRGALMIAACVVAAAVSLAIMSSSRR